jgi:hypothetical protein
MNRACEARKRQTGALFAAGVGGWLVEDLATGRWMPAGSGQCWRSIGGSTSTVGHCAQFCAHHRTLLSATGVCGKPLTADESYTCSIQ